MISAPVYIEMAEPYLDEIKEWFLEYFGIKISDRQAIEFCIHTTAYYDQEVVSRSARRRFQGLSVKTFAIDESYRFKVNTILKNAKRQLHDSALFFTALIMQKAASLPQEQEVYSERILNVAAQKVDKDKFRPKWMGLMLK